MWVGADVAAAAFNPENREVYSSRIRICTGQKIPNIKILCCVHFHIAAQNSMFVYLTFIVFNFWSYLEFFLKES
jgi:hypothetical protein